MKFGVRFCDAFHIPTVPRKAVRKRVNDLHVRVLKLPQTEDVKKVGTDVAAVRVSVYGKVKTNAERKTCVDGATTECNRLETRLTTIETREGEKRERDLAANPGLAPVTGKAAKPTKDDEKRRKELLARREDLDKVLETAGPTLSGIIPDKGTLSFTALQLEAAAWLRAVGTETVTPERETELEAGYKRVTDLVDQTVATYAALRKEVERIRGTLLMEAAPVLETVRHELDGDAAALKQTPLSERFARLSNALAADVLFPDRLRVLKAELQEESKAADRDPKAYAARYRSAGKDAATAETLQAAFDTATAEAMRLMEKSCVPQDRVSALRIAAIEARKALAVPGNPPPDTAAAAKGIVDAVTREIADAAKGLGASRKAYDDLAKEIETLASGLQAALDVPHFRQEWDQVQGLRGAFRERMPLAELDREGLADLDAALALGGTLKARLQADQGMAAELAGFGKQLAAVKEWLGDDGRAGKNSALADFYPALQKKHAGAFAELEKKVGKSDATALAKTLAVLHAELDKDAEKARGENETLTNDVAGNVETMKSLYKSVYRKNPAKTISATEHGIALAAYKKAFEARPLDLKKVQDAAAAVRLAFTGTTTEAELLAKYATGEGDRDAMKNWRKNQVAALEAEKAGLVDRLNALKGRLDFTESVVDDAHGDANAAKAAKALFAATGKQVDKHVKSGRKLIEAAADRQVLARGDAAEVQAAKDELQTLQKTAKDATERMMERLDERLDLMLVRPEGQRGAKLKALPELFKRWEGTRRLAGENLGAFAATLRGYTPADPGAAGRRDTLAAAVDGYRAFVTGETAGVAGAVSRLISVDAVPDADRRRAREDALGDIHERQAAISGHPMSGMLAKCPFDEARTVPARLFAVLAQLEFTILTAVE